jgi:hypothetical protein
MAITTIPFGHLLGVSVDNFLWALAQVRIHGIFQFLTTT